MFNNYFRKYALRSIRSTTFSTTNNQIVTPWKVEGEINYNKLVDQFGTELIDENLIQRFERVVNRKIHPWISRNIFFTHRGLSNFLTAYENKEPIFLYTGRGPSSEAMHLGHLVPFIMTKWLQETFNCPLIIQIADEEKSAFKGKNFNEIYKLGFSNAKDIIACGFNPDKTFIFSNRDYRLKCKNFELLATNMKTLTSLKEIQKIFGLNEDSNISMYDWPFYQTAAAYYLSYPHIFNDIPAYCLVPYAIDQDPYFRLARDLSTRMNLPKPSSIMSTFVPSLERTSSKMSSSVGQAGTIFLNDSPKIIKDKVMKYSFSGGGGDGSLYEHKKYGGNPEIDTAYQYLRYFEMDDDKLDEIRVAFIKGDLSCAEIKKILVDKLVVLLSEIQKNRNNVNSDLLNQFYLEKTMSDVNKTDIKSTDSEMKVYKYLSDLNIKYITKYHTDINFLNSDSLNKLKISLRGVICKTLLLRGQGKDFYLCIVNHDRIVDINEIKKKIQISKLNYAERDTAKYLFSEGNCDTSFILSPFSLINYMTKDKDTIYNHSLSILFERDLETFEYLNFNPLRIDASTSILSKDALKFFSSFKIKFISI